MSFEASKFLQNVELKLRGRTAIVVIGLGVECVLFWLVLKDYSIHPLLSAVLSSVLVLAALGTLSLGLFGKTRPEEVPEKSFVHVDQVGIYVAQGIGSHKDMVRLMREVTGMKSLPLPSHRVEGSAADASHYVQLSADESRKIVAEIDSRVEGIIRGAVGQTGGLIEAGKQLPNPEETKYPPPIRGKDAPVES